MKREGFYLSCDHKTKIHAVAWIPENREIRAVIQLCHGMTEYVNRYDEFARWLAEKGYYVTGHDHLGHGQSVLSEEDYGYFPEKVKSERLMFPTLMSGTKLKVCYVCSTCYE